MEQIHQKKQQIKKLKSEADDLRTEILTDLKIKDLDSYKTDNLSLKLVVNKRKSFDKEKALNFIESKGGEKEEYFTESDVEILKIKEIQEAN